MKTVKILLVDDHQLIREGIKHILELQNKFIPEIDEADNGNEAIQKSAIFNYSIIIMDISMPEKDGIETTKAILKKRGKAKILALSMFDETHYVNSMLDAGAMGYVLKTTGPEELSKAIITILGGEKFYSNEVAVKLLESPIISSAKPSKSRWISKLSKREVELIKMMSIGFSNSEIASKLFLSKRTVENHRFNIMKKLRVKNTAGIIKYALLNNMIKS